MKSVDIAKVSAEDAQVNPTPGEAEVRQLIGDSLEGTLARFLQNKLKLLIWYRSMRDPQLVFGAQLDLTRIIAALRESVQAPASLHGEITAALLDDNGKAVAGDAPQGRAPFVTREIGQALAHCAT